MKYHVIFNGDLADKKNRSGLSLEDAKRMVAQYDKPELICSLDITSIEICDSRFNRHTFIDYNDGEF